MVFCRPGSRACSRADSRACSAPGRGAAALAAIGLTRGYNGARQGPNHGAMAREAISTGGPAGSGSPGPVPWLTGNHLWRLQESHRGFGRRIVLPPSPDPVARSGTVTHLSIHGLAGTGSARGGGGNGRCLPRAQLEGAPRALAQSHSMRVRGPGRAASAKNQNPFTAR